MVNNTIKEYCIGAFGWDTYPALLALLNLFGLMVLLDPIQVYQNLRMSEINGK
jgi:hypothetical protein